MGITRDSILQIARDIGVPVVTRPITHADVVTADELFFSGTAVEVTPIKDVDGHVIGEGGPGPVTKRLQKTFFEAVHGKLPQYKQWLAFADVAQTV
jgi:branched-chain amino acid aminotransferase